MTLEHKLGRGIETAKDLRTAIEVVSEKEADFGTVALISSFRDRFPDLTNVSLIPIMLGGSVVGRDIARTVGVRSNPMRMSYYTSVGVRLPKARCLQKPNIHKIVNFETGETKAVAFAEGVIDTEGTLSAAVETINAQVDQVNKQSRRKFRYPQYFTFALVSKVDGGPQMQNCYYAFKGHKDIWVVGRGFDLNGKGRNLKNVVGVISPFATKIPQAPYVTSSQFLVDYVNTLS